MKTLHLRLVNDEGATVDIKAVMSDASLAELHAAVVELIGIKGAAVRSATADSDPKKLPLHATAVSGTGRSIHVNQAEIKSSMISMTLAASLPVLPWTTEEGEYPPIETNGQVVCIPSNYLQHSGVEAPKASDDLLLYKRTPVQQLWDKIQHDTIDHAALLSIVGAPGAGKSSAAYAFASGLVNRTKLVVVWLHFVPRGDGFLCVKFDGNTKSTGKCTRRFLRWEYADQLTQTAFGVAENDTRGVIVFFDGWVNWDDSCMSSFRVLKAWSWEKPTKRRLVCVTSMASVARFNRPAKAVRDVSRKPSQDNNEDDQRTSADPDASSKLSVRNNDDDQCSSAVAEALGYRNTGGDANVRELLFHLPSWRIEEYEKAVRCETIFRSVRDALGADDGDGTQPNDPKCQPLRAELVASKYLVAGASARFMFVFDSATVQVALVMALAKVSNIEDVLKGFPSAHTDRSLLKGTVGVSSSAAVNTLYACYIGDRGLETRLVSPLAARLVASIVGPHVIQEFATAFAVNPSLDGQLFEMCVIGSLAKTGLHYKVKEQRYAWERASVVYFNANKAEVTLRLDWSLPTKWNQGGFDAVHWEKFDRSSLPGFSHALQVEQLKPEVQCLKFLQITRAETHSFNPKHFYELLQRLHLTDDQIAPARPSDCDDSTKEMQGPEEPDVATTEATSEPIGSDATATEPMLESKEPDATATEALSEPKELPLGVVQLWYIVPNIVLKTSPRLSLTKILHGRCSRLHSPTRTQGSSAMCSSPV